MKKLTLIISFILVTCSAFCQSYSYDFGWNNEKYTIVQYAPIKQTIGQSGKLSFDLNAGGSAGYRINGNIPVFGPYGAAYAEYRTGGIGIFSGFKAFSFFEQNGPNISSLSFTIGFRFLQPN